MQLRKLRPGCCTRTWASGFPATGTWSGCSFLSPGVWWWANERSGSMPADLGVLRQRKAAGGVAQAFAPARRVWRRRGVMLSLAVWQAISKRVGLLFHGKLHVVRCDINRAPTRAPACSPPRSVAAARAGAVARFARRARRSPRSRAPAPVPGRVPAREPACRAAGLRPRP